MMILYCRLCLMKILHPHHHHILFLQLQD
nr:unnamed protein product [Callosobruchus analis]